MTPYAFHSDDEAAHALLAPSDFLSRYQLEYLITLRSDSVVDGLSLILGLQIAIIVAVYYIKGVKDHRVRHTMFALYSGALLITLAKCLTDFALIGAYVKEMRTAFPLIHETKAGIMLLPEYAGEFFTTGISALYALLWCATLYFIYFHRFTAHREEGLKSPAPHPAGD